MLSPRDVEQGHRDALAAVGRVLGLVQWPDVPVRWNRRLRRAGRALIEGSGPRFQSAVIEISPAYFEVYPEDLRGILVHEVVHVGLALRGRAFGHTPAFRAACEAARGLQHGRALPGRVYRYRCPSCASVLERRRRLADDRWCAACVGRALEEGEADPYTRERGLVLVATAFSPRERAGACETGGRAAPGSLG